MAARPRTLTAALLEWVTVRLLMAQTDGTPPPHWPPSEQCRALLKEGRVDEALTVPDDPTARYVITADLRRDAQHILLARDVTLDREVVIKLIRAPNTLARVVAVREARMLARLSDPNVLSVLEVDPQGAYLVVERLHGDLRDHLGADRVVLLDALCQAGRGLAAVHRCGLWHGDFKLENVFVQIDRDESGRVFDMWAKLGDFGQARPAGPGADTLRGTSSQLPRGALEDQRAFAVAVWQALTAGQFPPHGGELIDPGLRAVLNRALMEDPSERWPEMSALVDAIERGWASTAAALSGPAVRSVLLDYAIAEAEAARYVEAFSTWKHAELAWAGQHRQLGEGGLRLAIRLTQVAAPAGVAGRGGFVTAVYVLLSAARYLTMARRHDDASFANGLVAAVCMQLVKLYADQPDLVRQFERIGNKMSDLMLTRRSMPETLEEWR